MKAKYLVLAIPAFLLISLAMSGMASADTEVNVNWESTNPDIYVSTIVNNGAADAWARVSGSGGIAAGGITVSGVSTGWGTATASQHAYFEGGDYTASLSAEGIEGGSGAWRTSQAFRVEGAEGRDDSSVPSITVDGPYHNTQYVINGAHVYQEAIGFRSPNEAKGFQVYSATGADLAVAQNSVYHYNMNAPARVREGTYIGNAYGDVEGSQAAYSGAYTVDSQPIIVGLGAGISGTEGTTYFEFSTDHIPNIAIFSDGYTIVGEAHTWGLNEDDPWDYDFNWIE